MSASLNTLVIDVGHGHVKALNRYNDPLTGQFVRKVIFPSLAQPISGANDASASMAAGLNVVKVNVGNRWFRVGKDIDLAVDASVERNRDDNFTRTPDYLALVHGALHYCGVQEIDMLVVGLPLTTLASNREDLIARLKGAHEVPAFNLADAAAGKTVRVVIHEVVVLAQALGALFAACEQEQQLSSPSERVLILDYGWHTLDVLASKGGRPFPHRLGALPGGVASYIDNLQRSVADTIRKNHPGLSGNFRVPSGIYEDALKTTSPCVTLGPGTFQLGLHDSVAVERLRNDLQSAVPLIQTSADITSIVLAGGGARLLRDPVRSVFPGINRVVVLDDPQFAIARGYLAFGESRALAGREPVRG